MPGISKTSKPNIWPEFLQALKSVILLAERMPNEWQKVAIVAKPLARCYYQDSNLRLLLVNAHRMYRALTTATRLNLVYGH